MANTFKNATLAVTTSTVAIYTTPGATTTVVQSIYLSNIDGVATPTVNVIIYDSSAATEFKIGDALPIGPGASLVFEKTINLEAADELRLSASANGDVEAVASVLEIT